MLDIRCASHWSAEFIRYLPSKSHFWKIEMLLIRGKGPLGFLPAAVSGAVYYGVCLSEFYFTSVI